MRIVTELKTTVTVDRGTLLFIPTVDKTAMQLTISKHYPVREGSFVRVELRLTKDDLLQLGKLFTSLAEDITHVAREGDERNE